MSFNFVDTNLCNHTDQIMDIWAAKRAEKKYFPDSALSGKIEKDTLQKSSEKAVATTDGKDDGKISFKEKLQNFGKGIVAPIKTMFSSPKNIAITAASVALGAGLIWLTGGAAAPVMVGAGLLTGGYQIGKGIYRQSNATTDNEAKEAWQDMGSGTFTVGVSAAGAKASLKAAGATTPTGKGSTLSAMFKCIKDAPKFIKSGFTTASSKISGLFSGVKAGAITPVKTPTTGKAGTAGVEPEVIPESDVIVLPKKKGNIPKTTGSEKPVIEGTWTETTETIIPETKVLPFKKSSEQLALPPAKTEQTLALPAAKEVKRLPAPKEVKRLPAAKETAMLDAPAKVKTSWKDKLKLFFKVFGFFKSDGK